MKEKAKKHIPRRKQAKYKPFWNKNVKEQRIRRDKARKKAEISKLPEDVIEWRKETARLRQHITISKKETWNKFLNGVDYRTDVLKTHKFINKLNNKYPKHNFEPW
jgi:hypothetical protein